MTRRNAIVALLPRTPGERLWKVWWLWGIPVGWAASAMLISAESMRVAGAMGWADLVDACRLLLYVRWARLAWRWSHNVEDTRWTPVARLALGAGLVSMVMF